MSWEPLDTEALLQKQRQQQEQTTSANAGGYTVPIGGVLRRQIPVANPPTIEKVSKKRKRS